MRRRHSPLIDLFLLGASAAACSDPVSNTPPPADAGTDVPVVLADTPAVDAPAADAPAADAPAADAPAGDVGTLPLNCGGAEVLDLNALGTTTDGVLRYTGMSPMMMAMGTPLMIPMCTALFNVPRILRYTAPAAGRVVFSTDNMGTTFDTTLAVLTSCPGPTATSLGCIDDNGVTTRLSSIVRPERALAAGESVYVVVGSYPPMGGTFALSVATVMEVGLGAACDGDRLCMAGATCIAPPMPSTTGARCVANGTSGGACRPASATGTRCDADLACTAGDRCVPTVAAGAECDPTGVINACAMGTACRGLPGASGIPTNPRCVADGALAGTCRAAPPRCDTGLGCSTIGQCVPQVAAGAACGAVRDADVCVSGTSCQVSGTGRLCVADGALNGACRTTASPCDTGLGCTRAGLCLTVVAVGAACDFTGSTNVCAAASSCQGSPGLYRCVADGVLGGQCRASMGCDAGLGCNTMNFCVTGVAAGATCDPSSVSSVCVSGSVCAGSPGMYRCQLDGTLGGRCRAAAPRCDTGLGCGTDRCVPTVAAGAACDPARTANVCADASSCITGTSGASTCVADGTAGGRCRATGTPCNAGFGCGGDRCVPVVAAGAACDPSRTANVCADATSCIAGMMGTATCVADGVAGGRCRGTAMPCNTGLGCGAGQRCVTAVAMGAACDPLGVTNACVSPARCTPMVGSKMRTCQLPSYVESEIASPAFVDACTADASRPTFMALDDAVSGSLPIGFTLRAYGADHTTMLVSTNGNLILGDAALAGPPPISGGADVFPWVGAPRPVFAAFWDDLVLRTAGSVCVRTTGTAPARTTVVEWFDATLYMNDSARLTFEIILREGSNQVDFIYQTLTANMAPAARLEGSTAGVGVQGPMGIDANRHVGPVTTARGIRFAPR